MFIVPTGPPTNVRVISRGPTFVTIEWNDPLPEDINDRDGIISYHIKLNGSNAGSTSERMFTLTHLQPGRTQHIQIIPVNDQGKAKEQFAGEASAITSAGGIKIRHQQLADVNVSHSYYMYLYIIRDKVIPKYIGMVKKHG